MYEYQCLSLILPAQLLAEFLVLSEKLPVKVSESPELSPALLRPPVSWGKGHTGILSPAWAVWLSLSPLWLKAEVATRRDTEAYGSCFGKILAGCSRT